MFGWVAIAALVTAALTWGAALAAVRPLAARQHAHWTERARYAFQARQAVLTAALLPPVFVAVSAAATLPFGGAIGLLAIVTAFVASTPARLYVERRALQRQLSLRAWVRGRVAWWLVMTPHLLVVVALTLVAPRPLGAATFAVFGLGVAATVIAAFGGTLRLARVLGLAVPAGPRLAQLVAESAARASVSAPPAYELEMPIANAFAWVHLGAIGVTRGALEALSDDELRAVLAHELGHLAEPRAVAVVRSLGMLALTPLVLILPLVFARHFWAIGLLLLAMIVTMRAVRLVARRMEERADRAAHAAEADPGTYAGALATLYEANAMPAVMPGKRPVHPHLYDRLVSAGVTPTWPRPAPPPVGGTRIIAFGCLAAPLILAVLSGVAYVALAVLLAMLEGCAPAVPQAPVSVAIACGSVHSCELRSDGVVRCWGGGDRGQLGDGAASESSGPRVVASLERVGAIAAGGDTTCAVERSGAVLCWGRNDHGQVGDGTILDRRVPTHVLGLPPARAVSVGFAHACAVDREGRAWCWGFNGSGAITPGGGRSIAAPMEVLAGTRAAQLVAGAFATCVVDAGGRAACIGDATALPPAPLENVRGVVLDVGWSCFAQGDALRCYGLRPGGTRERLPDAGEVFGSFAPRLTSGGGIDHACAIDAAGVLHCFGKNDQGQLSGSMARGPEPVVVELASTATAVAVGEGHSCAIAGGETWCWGANGLDQLGDGSGITSLDPLLVAR